MLADTETGIARQVIHQLFADVDPDIAVALSDGTSLYEPTQPTRATIVLRNSRTLHRLIERASDLSAGEAIMSGDINVVGDTERVFDAMDAVAATRRTKDWVKAATLIGKLPRPDRAATQQREAARLRGRLHTPQRDQDAISYHYDVSNEFYKLWLDAEMTYSCAYFKSASDSLDRAQQQKYDLICRKLRLAPGERVLDVGCGWGGFIRFAAHEYGAQAVGITLSQCQVEYAREQIALRGLAERCRVELMDYRSVGELGIFDKAVSIGMVEHVGDAMLDTYFKAVFNALAPGAIFLNHGIIAQHPKPTGLRALAERFFPSRSRFTENYVFPDGQIPRLAPMTHAAQAAGFEVRDVENLRDHYTQTLRHWLDRLESHEAQARALVGDATYNIWRFWLAGSAHNFATARLGVVQMLLAKIRSDGSVRVPLTRADIYGDGVGRTTIMNP